MGLFGRSDEIDYTKKEQKAIWSWLKWIDKYAKDTNKTLNAIIANLQQLQKNNQRIAALESIIATLKQRDDAFQKTIQAMQQRDEKFSKAIATLGTLSTETSEEATTE